GGDPVRRPCAFIGVVDAGKRLERNGRLVPFREATAQIVPIPAHGERGGADRTAKVEGEDLAGLVAAELQRHKGEQHALARTCGADDKGVPYVADMET